MFRQLVPFYRALTPPADVFLVQYLEQEPTAHTLNKLVCFLCHFQWFEKLINLPANIPKLAGTAAAARGGQMVINTEWGAFNNSVSHLSSQSSLSSSYLIISALTFPQLPLITQLTDSVSIRNTKHLRNSFLECIWAKLFATSCLP